MTFERRCTVEPTDILSLNFECKACGYAYRFPVDKLDGNGLIALAQSSCASCGTPSGFASGTMEINTLINFGKAVKDLVRTAEGRNLRVKMEMKCSDLESK